MRATPAEWEGLLNPSEALFPLFGCFIGLISACAEHALFDHDVFQLASWFKHMYFTCSSVSLFRKHLRPGEKLKSVLLKITFIFLGRSVLFKFFHPLYNLLDILVCSRPNQSQGSVVLRTIHVQRRP